VLLCIKFLIEISSFLEDTVDLFQYSIRLLAGPLSSVFQLILLRGSTLLRRKRCIMQLKEFFFLQRGLIIRPYRVPRCPTHCRWGFFVLPACQLSETSRRSSGWGQAGGEYMGASVSQLGWESGEQATCPIHRNFFELSSCNVF